MEKKRRAAFDPPPGIILGETDYSIPGQWCAGSNVRFADGKAQPIGGWNILHSTPLITDNCVAMLEWYSKAGGRYLALGATGGISVLSDASLSTATDIEPAGITSSSSNRWTFDLWGDNLIACLKGGLIYSWDLNLANNLVAVTNAPTVNTVALVTDTRQLMALGTKEETSGTFNPRCIRWSDTEDNTDWTTLPSNLAGEYILDGSGGSIRCARKIGTYIIVWTDDELFLGRFTGQADNPWVFERQAVGCGCLGTDNATVADGVAYWVSTDLRLMMWVPGTPPIEIPGIPSHYLTGTIFGATGLPQAFVWHNRRFNEVWFHLPSVSTFPTTYISVNVRSLGTNRPIWMTGAIQNLSVMYQGINGVYGHQGVTEVYQHEVSKTGVVGGNLLACSIEALVYIDKGQQRAQIQRLIPDIESQSGNLTCTISKLDYPQGAEVTSQTKTLAAGDDRSDFRASGRLFRIKFSSNDGTGGTDTFWRLGRVMIEYVMMGER